MAITVSDCLRLPSLREAKVVAGHKGLNKFVTTVSVLEYAKRYALAKEYFLGNELILTGFISVKDNIEDQCEALRRLHEVGEAGVVLYYVGCFLPELHPALIETADELGFPLIVMPEKAYYLRYSEVITEVLQLIFSDQQKETYYVKNILEQIAKMRERQRNIESVLRLLSDRLRCSFLLLSYDGTENGYASWPIGSKKIFDSMMRYRKRHAPKRECSFFQSEEKDHAFRLFQQKFDTQYQKSLQLVALDEGMLLNEFSFRQAIEVIQMFSSIWKYDFETETEDELVRAIINDQPLTMNRIAKKYFIDLKRIRVMWVLKSRRKSAERQEELAAALERQKKKIQCFLKENGKNVLVDTFDNGVVAFMDDAPFPEMETPLAETFMEQFGEPDEILIWCGGMDSTKAVRSAYRMIEDSFETICKLYPAKKVFTEGELEFALECLRIMEKGENAIERYQQSLFALVGQKDERGMIDTLSVYLLDANRSISATAGLLYLHDSTVKYRLNKIKQRLGYDMDMMPGAYYLYLAVALKRLT